jgi:hypothetical protein
MYREMYLLFVKLRNAANNNRQVAMGLYGMHSPDDVTMTVLIQFCHKVSELSPPSKRRPTSLSTTRNAISLLEIPSCDIKQRIDAEDGTANTYI